MPNYEYQCEKCGVFEVFKPMSESSREEKCKCGRKAERVYSLQRPIVDNFQPAYYRDFGHEPIFIKSKRQLIDTCAKYHVACKGLDKTAKYWDKIDKKIE